MPKCSKCGEDRPLSDFYKAAGYKNNHRLDCKECSKKRSRKQPYSKRSKQKEEYYMEIDKGRRKHRRVATKSELKRLYDMSLVQYDNMFEDQKGLCAICQKPCKLGRRLGVDHCHKAGKIRGLLCSQCNLGLGSFQDNIENLLNAANYLSKNGSR